MILTNHRHPKTITNRASIFSGIDETLPASFPAGRPKPRLQHVGFDWNPQQAYDLATAVVALFHPYQAYLASGHSPPRRLQPPTVLGDDKMILRTQSWVWASCSSERLQRLPPGDGHDPAADTLPRVFYLPRCYVVQYMGKTRTRYHSSVFTSTRCGVNPQPALESCRSEPSSPSGPRSRRRFTFRASVRNRVAIVTAVSNSASLALRAAAICIAESGSNKGTEQHE